MKRAALLLIFLLVGTVRLSAQVCLTKGGSAICVDAPVSREKIVGIFGEPSRIREHEDEAAGGRMEVYEYEKLKIAVVDGIVYDFAFDDAACRVLVNGKYGLGIGDGYEAFLQALPAGTAKCRKYDGEVQLFFRIDGTDYFSDSSLIVCFDSKGLVTLIRWFSPV